MILSISLVIQGLAQGAKIWSRIKGNLTYAKARKTEVQVEEFGER